MRLYTILLILIAFLMNGCLADRIKQRIYARELKKRQLKYIPQKSVKNSQINKPKLYTPSPAPKKLYQDKKEYKSSYKKKIVTKKKIKSRVSKKKVTKKRVKKIIAEPYSIEKNEADPELLGPQTTLESNPLTKK